MGQIKSSKQVIIDKYLARDGDGDIIDKIKNMCIFSNSVCSYVKDIGDININTTSPEYAMYSGLEPLDYFDKLRINIGFVNIKNDDHKYRYEHHCNSLIFVSDNDNNWSCIRFEPRGYGTLFYNQSKIDTIIKELLTDIFGKINYISPSEYQLEEGPQFIDGLCTAHSLQFVLDYMIFNPYTYTSSTTLSEHVKNINTSLFKKDIIEFIDRYLLN